MIPHGFIHYIYIYEVEVLKISFRVKSTVVEISDTMKIALLFRERPFGQGVKES